MLARLTWSKSHKGGWRSSTGCGQHPVHNHFPQSGCKYFPEQNRVDVAPADDRNDAAGGQFGPVMEDRGGRGGAARLDDKPRLAGEHPYRVEQLVVGDREDPVEVL